MNTLPIKIYPGFFNKQPRIAEHRVSVSPASFRAKPTTTERPSNPRAIYAMPIVAVVMAVGSIAGGAAAIAAGTAVLGSVALGTVLAGAMIVGGAATLIGIATDNKNLVKYGGILALAGGLSLAAAGAFGGLTTDAGLGSTTGIDVAGGPPMSGMAGPSVADAAATLPEQLSGPGVLSTQRAANVSTPVGVPEQLSGPGMTNAAPGVLATRPPAPVTDLSQPFNTGGQDTFRAPVIDKSTVNTTFNASSPKGFFDKAGKWMQDNQTAAKIGYDAVAGYAKGKAAEPLQQSEIALNTATASYRARAAAIAAQRADWGRGVSKPLDFYMGG